MAETLRTVPGLNGAHSHGAGAPVQTRSERRRSREVSDFAKVTGREPEWRYTPVDTLETLLSGNLSGAPIVLPAPGNDGVVVEGIPATDARVGQAGLPEERLSANALTHVTTVNRVAISAATVSPIVLCRCDLGAEPRAGHTIIDIAPGVKATVLLEGCGHAHFAENVEIVVGDGADLTVIALQRWADDAIHAATHFARVGKDAALTHLVFSLTGTLVRVNSSFHLVGEGASVEALGLYYSSSGQHLEQQVFVHHDAPHTRSRVTYKGALEGDGARSVWIGDVLIGNRATAADSYEQNRNLVLSEGTRAYSVPNLEIETGDIAGAGHASATGRFDEEQLFYLRSRGIPEDEAIRLVISGFLTEIVQRVSDSQIRERIEGLLEQKRWEARR